MTIHALYRTPDGRLQSDLPAEQIPAAIAQKGGLLWVDLDSESDEQSREILTGVFDFHPLAVDDALVETHSPKLDDWGSYLYLVLHAVSFDRTAVPPLKTLELDIFVGATFVVSYHTRPIPALTRTRETCLRDPRHLEHGPGRLLYWLADELVADYMPVVERVDEAIDAIEDQIFDGLEGDLLEQIFSLKRGLLLLRRILAPQREVLNKLARGDSAVLPLDERVFFRDVYDHLVRMYDIIEGMRDLLSGAVDTHLSVVNNRMNQVMKTLTVITTLFMPISFLVGFFGTNFFQPVAGLYGWTGQPAFVAMLLLMVLLPVGMFIWMRKRSWM